MMSDLIDLLAKRQLVWRGRERAGSADAAEQHKAYVASGYEGFDQALQGLPRTGVVAINTSPGVGELRLLLPALQTLQDESEQRLCVFINPPGQICAEFFYHQGFELKNIIVVKTRDKTEALWAAESCAKSGACTAVLLWHNFFEAHQIKRLQLASEAGDCMQVLLRSPQHSRLSLPVALSVQLTPISQGLNIHVMKRKGGWPIADFDLDMSRRWPSLSLQEQALQQTNVLKFPLGRQHKST